MKFITKLKLAISLLAISASSALGGILWLTTDDEWKAVSDALTTAFGDWLALIAFAAFIYFAATATRKRADF